MAWYRAFVNILIKLGSWYVQKHEISISNAGVITIAPLYVWILSNAIQTDAILQASLIDGRDTSGTEYLNRINPLAFAILYFCNQA